MHEMHTSGENCDASETLKTFIKNEAEGNTPEKQKEGLKIVPWGGYIPRYPKLATRLPDNILASPIERPKFQR